MGKLNFYFFAEKNIYGEKKLLVFIPGSWSSKGMGGNKDPFLEKKLSSAQL